MLCGHAFLAGLPRYCSGRSPLPSARAPKACIWESSRYIDFCLACGKQGQDPKPCSEESGEKELSHEVSKQSTLAALLCEGRSSLLLVAENQKVHPFIPKAEDGLGSQTQLCCRTWHKRVRLFGFSWSDLVLHVELHRQDLLVVIPRLHLTTIRFVVIF